jgi:DNA-binding GntR family transcriptional regulator
VQAGDAYQRLNHEFHFALFECSPLELVRQEISRLWFMSGFYRSLYLHETQTSTHLQDEHDQIIDAVRAGSMARLIENCDRHRSGTERLVVQRLNRRRPT